MLISPRVAHLLDRKLGAYRQDVRGLDPALDEALAYLHEAAAAYRAQREARIDVPEPTSAPGSTEVDSGVAGAESAVMVTVREAAPLLGCSERWVRQLVATGELVPIHRRPILLDRDDVLDLADMKETTMTDDHTPGAA